MVSYDLEGNKENKNYKYSDRCTPAGVIQFRRFCILFAKKCNGASVLYNANNIFGEQVYYLKVLGNVSKDDSQREVNMNKVSIYEFQCRRSLV